MNKEERIKRYGKEAYEKLLAQNRERSRKYREEHPEEVIAHNQEQTRKGGKRYDKNLECNKTGLRGERSTIRQKHARQYKPYKDIVAQESQIHHEWIPNTAEYRGVALVEKEAHMHGFVDVIEILDGKITLLTEEEVRNPKRTKRFIKKKNKEEP